MQSAISSAVNLAEFFNAPVFLRPIRKIPPDDQLAKLPLLQLTRSDLQTIRAAHGVDQGRVVQRELQTAKADNLRRLEPRADIPCPALCWLNWDIFFV